MRTVLRAFSGSIIAAVTLGLFVTAGALLRPNTDDDGRDFGRGGGEERSFSVLVDQAKVGLATPVIQAYGRVETAARVTLRSETVGKVVALSPNLRIGGSVIAGEPLVQLDQTDAEFARDRAAADLADMEAQLVERRAALALMREELRIAQTQRSLQANALERTQGLASRGTVTDAALETAELSLSQAEQTLLSRRQALITGEAAVTRGEIARDRAALILRDAERSLSDTNIVAPFDARIEATSLNIGQHVSANEALATLIDPQALEVSFRIANSEFARLADANGILPEMTAVVTLSMGDVPYRVSANVLREGPAVADGETGRTLFAALAESAGAILRPGDFVTVEISEPPLSKVAILPASAVSSENVVLLVDAENRLSARSVEVLRRQGDFVFLRGLSEADRYIVAQQPQLGEGVQVRPINRATASQPVIAEAPETITLDPERRAKLLAFLDANTRMPDAVKSRMRAALEQPEVPADVVERLERRMGG